MESRSRTAQKAVFLDRDGTLIEEVNYLSRVEDLRVFPCTFEALRLLKDAGFMLIVVTNQSGIGRGVYDEAAMHSIHSAMQKQLGNMIDAFYFCPHLPCDGCLCRKPMLGMLESAASDFSVDMPGSWMIGDKKIDIETARNAGLKSGMVMTGYGRVQSKELATMPDVLGEDLLAVVLEVLR